jgi:hypothetical protein
MKHIQLFEDYSEEELRDLIGDLRGVGHHKVDFDITFDDYPETEETERNAAESWTSKTNPKIFLIVVEGTIAEETTDLDFVFSNGDLANLDYYYAVGPWSPSSFNKDRGIFTLNSKMYKVYEKYLELLENGSVVKAAMEIYDEIKSGTIK